MNSAPFILYSVYIKFPMLTPQPNLFDSKLHGFIIIIMFAEYVNLANLKLISHWSFAVMRTNWKAKTAMDESLIIYNE